MHVELTERERKELLAVLEVTVAVMPVEMRHADNRKWRGCRSKHRCGGRFAPGGGGYVTLVLVHPHR